MGDKQTAYVEINGKRYDARSGKLLRTVDAAKPAVKAPAKPIRHHGRHHGSATSAAPTAIKAAKTVQKPAVTAKAKIKAPTKAAASKPRSDIKRQPGKVAARHARQQAQTLMRRSVLRPSGSAKPVPLKPAQSLVVRSEIRRSSEVPSAQPKVSASSVEPSRVERAQSTPKSPAVSRYGKPLRFQDVAAAKPQPQQAAQPSPNANVSAPAKTNSQAFFERAIASAKPTPAKNGAKKHKKSLAQRLTASFQRQKSVFVVAASASAIVIIGAFALVANMNNIELKVAGIRAGIATHMPQYQPSGFDKNANVAYAPGKVTLSFFASDQSGRSYQLSQEKSDWNSTSLYDSLIAVTNEPYQTVQQRGNIIYLYGDSKAAWVTGGTLYQINGNAADLSSDELLRIADSV